MCIPFLNITLSNTTDSVPLHFQTLRKKLKIGHTVELINFKVLGNARRHFFFIYCGNNIGQEYFGMLWQMDAIHYCEDWRVNCVKCSNLQ